MTGKNAYNTRLTIKEREESMATGKAFDGKPYAGNPHVRFDEGEVAPAATPRRGSLLYKPMPLTVGSFKTEDGRLGGFVTEGEVTGDQIEKAFFGTGFVFRKDDGDCQKMLNYMSRNGYRHHVAFVRGNWSAAIVEAFSNYLGFEIERV